MLLIFVVFAACSPNGKNNGHENAVKAKDSGKCIDSTSFAEETYSYTDGDPFYRQADDTTYDILAAWKAKDTPFVVHYIRSLMDTSRSFYGFYYRTSFVFYITGISYGRDFDLDEEMPRVYQGDQADWVERKHIAKFFSLYLSSNLLFKKVPLKEAQYFNEKFYMAHRKKADNIDSSLFVREMNRLASSME